MVTEKPPRWARFRLSLFSQVGSFYRIINKLQADVVTYTVHVINPVENKGYYYTPSQKSCPPIVGGFFAKAELTRVLTFFCIIARVLVQLDQY